MFIIANATVADDLTNLSRIISLLIVFYISSFIISVASLFYDANDTKPNANNTEAIFKDISSPIYKLLLQ